MDKYSWRNVLLIPHFRCCAFSVPYGCLRYLKPEKDQIQINKNRPVRALSSPWSPRTRTTKGRRSRTILSWGRSFTKLTKHRYRSRYLELPDVVVICTFFPEWIYHIPLYQVCISLLQHNIPPFLLLISENRNYLIEYRTWGFYEQL